MNTKRLIILIGILLNMAAFANAISDISFPNGKKILNTNTMISGANPTANPNVYNMDKLNINLPDANIDKKNFNQMLGAAGNKTAFRMGMMDKTRNISKGINLRQK